MMRVLLLAAFAAHVSGQSAVPETAFISPARYANAFFGFSIPLPQGTALHELAAPPPSSDQFAAHYLFGLEANDRGVAAMTVLASNAADAVSGGPRKAASGPDGFRIKPVTISGKEFWKSDIQERVATGKLRKICLATTIRDYVVVFNIVSSNPSLASVLERSIEAIAFFDPSEAGQAAGPQSRPFVPAKPAGAPPTSSRVEQLSPGVLSGNVYTNDALGFSYEFGAGWNDTTQRSAQPDGAFGRCSRDLLSIGKLPVGFESSPPLFRVRVVLFAIDPACMSGAHFPASVEDRAAIEEAGRQFIGPQRFISNLEKYSVSAFTTEGHLMIDVSASYAVNPKGLKAPIEIFNALDFTEINGFWVAWGYVAESEARLQELRKAPIRFMR